MALGTTAWTVLVLAFTYGAVAAVQSLPGPYPLPKLPYGYDALEPFIDARTVKLHHEKHQQAAVAALNKAIEGATAFATMSPEELLANLDRIPEAIRTAVANNAGSAAAHRMYWMCLGPYMGGQPKGDIGAAIDSSFGGFTAFKEQFTATAIGLLGSGWIWLVDDHGKLAIVATQNHGSPITAGQTPLLVLDVWEHAYYLKYQNRRADYVAAWWHLVNWKEVERRLKEARSAPGAGTPAPAAQPAAGW